MPKNLRIGDLIEIPIKGGLRYIHYVMDSPQSGQMIRVLPGTWKTRPLDFSDIAQQNELYLTFLPLKTIVRRAIFEVVGNKPVPSSIVDPTFRAVGAPGPDGIERTWWLSTEEREWRV